MESDRSGENARREIAKLFSPQSHGSSDLTGERRMDDPASFFVGWGTLSLINAGLAQGKGRSGLIWWLLSMLLGPIATLLIVILPREVN